MALPAMHALARCGPLQVVGPRWVSELYRDVPRVEGGDAQVAVVFPPSLRAAWRVRRVPRRIGTPTDHRGWLLTEHVKPGIHTRDTYARLAEAAGAHVVEPPQWTARPGDPEVDLPDGHVGLNPLSATGAVRTWPEFRALANGLPGPVVFYGGPGEDAALAAIAGPHPTCVGLSLAALGRALARCRVFVSADTGPAHFAAACGVRTVVVYGSTSPASTGPWGAEAVQGPLLPCAPCYRPTCRLDRPRCFDGLLDDVRARVA
jgi:heptosyltransferase-2